MNNLVKAFLVFVGVLVTFGIVLPWLISAANTALVILGVLIMLALVLWAVLYIVKLINTKEDKPQDNVVKDEKKI